MEWVEHPSLLVDKPLEEVIEDIVSYLDYPDDCEYPIEQILNAVTESYGYNEEELLGLALKRYWEIQDEYLELFRDDNN